MNRSTTVNVLSALTLLAAAQICFAGPLAPPAGPVTTTLKTLGEVEPRIAINSTSTPGDADSSFKITQPGSYYLTGNLLGVSGKMGIEVAASNVTIDLNGFNVIGVPGSLTGVNAFQMSRVVVRNGTVSSWGSRGVIIGAGGAVTDVNVDHCGSTGIECTLDCSVSHCHAIVNVTGIAVSRGSSVQDCIANDNSDAGITSDTAALIVRCMTSHNGAAGIDVGTGVTVQDCNCSTNLADGITADTSCTITGNTCTENGDDGIQVFENCIVSHNHCSSNDPAGDGAGVYIHGPGNRIEDNLFYSNRYGVSCSGLDNFIVKNTCRANVTQNFSIQAGNEFATAIINPGSNNFATMTPWSNVSY